MSTVIVSPDIIFSECGDSYCVLANTHGLSMKDIAVNIARGMLTLSGSRWDEGSEDLDDGQDPNTGSFLYNVALPEDVDTHAVSGWLDHGILTMTIGRAHEQFI